MSAGDFNDHPNVVQTKREFGETDMIPPGGEILSEGEVDLRRTLTYILTLFPKLSPSMIQVGIGTSLPPALWKPVLARMVQEGLIRQDSVSAMTPRDQQRNYTIYSLAAHPKASSLVG